MIDDKKICNKCGETKLLTAFSPQKETADGKRGICKKCINQAKALKNENNKIAGIRNPAKKRYTENTVNLASKYFNNIN